MISNEELNTILERIVKKQQTEADITVLQQWLSGSGQIVSQQGKYAVNLGQGQEIHIGDITYQGADAETIQQIVHNILLELVKQPSERDRTKLNPSKGKIFDLPHKINIKKFVGLDPNPGKTVDPDNGRIKLLEKLQKALIGDQSTQKKRIVYLTGNGGVGKSTLAYYFAEQYKEDKNQFKDGIVGLRINSEAKESAQSIASRLIAILKTYDRTIESDDEVNAINAINLFFSYKDFLIILDNANESIIKILSKLVPDNNSKCAVIVTTRKNDLPKQVQEYLDLAAYSETIPIPKLEIHESLELLKEVMEKKDFEEKEQCIGEEIVRIIDNLPLAVRIVGSTLKGFKELHKDNSENYYTKLEGYTKSLRNAEERLKKIDELEVDWSTSEEKYDWSIEACYDLSLDLLSTHERDAIIRFFSSLSVCAEEGFSKKVATVINNCDEASTSKYLTRLCSLSLVDQSEDKKDYYILHPVVYAFAVKKLKDISTQNDQIQQIKERHAKFFLEKVRVFETDENYENSEEDKPNILKALGWLYQVLKELEIKELRENKKTLKQFLFSSFSFLRPKSFPDKYEYSKQVAEGLNKFFEKYSDPSKAVEVFSIFQRLAQEMQDEQSCIMYRLWQAKFYSHDNKLKEAENIIKPIPEILARLKRINTRKEYLECKIKWQIRYGRLLLQQKKIKMAQDYLTKGVTDCRRIKNKELLRSALFARADFFWEQHQLEKAIKDYQKIIPLCDNANTRKLESLINCLINLFFLLKLQEKNQEAQEYDNKVNKICNSPSSQEQLARKLNYIGNKFFKIHKETKLPIFLTAAIEAFEYQAKINERNGDYRLVAINSMHIGALLIRQERYSEARESLNRAIKFREFLDNTLPLLSILTKLGNFLGRKQNKYIESIEVLQDVIDISRKNKDWKTLAKGLNILGWTYKNIGNVSEAIQAFIEQWQIGENHEKRQISYARIGLETILREQHKEFLEQFERIIENEEDLEKNRVLIGYLHVLSNKMKFFQEYDIATKTIEFAKNISNKKNDTKLEIDGLFNLAKLKLEQNKVEPCMALSLEIVDLYQKIPEKKEVASMFLSLGKLLTFRQEFDKAKELLEIQITISSSLEEQSLLIQGRMTLGGLLKKQNMLDKSLKEFTEAADAANRAKDISFINPIIGALINLGNQLCKKGNIKDAATASDCVLKLAKDSEDLKSMTRGYKLLGQVKLDEGKPEEAARCFIEQIRISQRIKDTQEIQRGTKKLVEICSKLKEFDSTLFEDILEVLQYNHEAINYNTRKLGKNLQENNELVKALRVFELIIHFSHDTKSNKHRLELQKDITELCEKLVSQEDYKHASTAILLLFNLSKAIDNQRDLVEQFIKVGQELDAQDSLVEAEKLFRYMITICEDTNDIIFQPLGYSLLGNTLRKQNFLSKALSAFQEQIRICELPEFRAQPEYKYSIQLKNGLQRSSKLLRDGLENLRELMTLQYDEAMRSLKSICERYDHLEVKTSVFKKKLAEIFDAFDKVLDIDDILYSRRSIVKNYGFHNNLKSTLKKSSEKWNDVTGEKYYLERSIKLAQENKRGLEKRAFYIVGQILCRKKNDNCFDYLNKAIELEQGENCEQNYLAKMYRARGYAYAVYGNIASALGDFKRSFALEEKSGNPLNLEIITGMLVNTFLKQAKKDDEVIIYCKRALAIAPESFVLQELNQRLNSSVSHNKLVKTESSNHREKFANYFKYVERYEGNQKNVWIPRICIQNNWILSTWVYRYSSNSFEIALFLTKDCFLFVKDGAIIAALMYCLSDAYFYTGKMQLTFGERTQGGVGPNDPLDKGFEPKVPDSIIRVAQHFGVKIEKRSKFISDKQGKELYIKITGFTGEILELFEKNKIDPVRISFLMNRGIWTYEQIELLIRYSHDPKPIFNGKMSLENFLMYQRDLLLLRFGLMAEQFKNILYNLNDMRDQTLTVKWLDINKQVYFSTHPITIKTIFGECSLSKETRFKVIYLCHNHENYDFFAKKYFNVSTSEEITIFTVTKDFDWISQTTSHLVSGALNIVKIPNKQGELTKEVYNRLLRSSSHHKPLPERPE